MPSRLRLLVLSTCLVPLLAASPVSLDTLPYLTNLPASNPYREILLRYAELPADQHRAFGSWFDGRLDPPDHPAPSLSPDQLNLIRELTASLVTASDHPALTASDWPLIPNPDAPDNPAAITLPALSLARDLARLAVKHADSLPPGEALHAYAAVAQLARQQRAGSTLIEHLTGVAVEGIAFSAASRRLNEFSAPELLALSQAWSSLAPLPSNATAFTGERDAFFFPLLENIVRPGLHALATHPQRAFTSASPHPDPDAGFTRDLRLSGLLDLGAGERRISLENLADRTTLTLREGGPAVSGIRLLRIDFDRQEAHLRRGTRDAIVHLTSKTIHESTPEQAITRLRQLFGSFALINTTNPDHQTPDYLTTLLERALAHPGGIDAYLDQLRLDYQTALDQQLAAADSPQANPQRPPPPDDPLLRLFTPTIEPIARRLNTAATAPWALQAALHHRLLTLGAAHDHLGPSDPWAGEEGVDFLHQTTDDGGFTLRSRYEPRPNAPLTFKFATPDAGFLPSRN